MLNLFNIWKQIEEIENSGRMRLDNKVIPVLLDRGGLLPKKSKKMNPVPKKMRIKVSKQKKEER